MRNANKGQNESLGARISKTIVVLGTKIHEDVLRKMNFGKTKDFCVGIDKDLRKFIQSTKEYARLILYLGHIIKLLN